MRCFALAAVALLVASPALAEWPVVPDAALTPGIARDLSVPTICAIKWGKDARAVTAAMKRQVFEEYHIPEAARHLADGTPAFEVDHLISREVGGADDLRNLWPQSYSGPWNAHLKDRVENRLHVEVCAGHLPLADAQRMISADWRIAYCRYFPGPPCDR